MKSGRTPWLDPVTRKRLRRFREMKRAWRSLLALLALYGVILFSELLCNNKPLYVHCSGRSFFPVFRTYPDDAFTGSGKKTRPDYKKLRRSPLFRRGPGNVMIDITRAVVTDQPYRPSAPERLLPKGPISWRVGRDPAVTAKVSSVPGLLFHVQFHFPGGRHMYMVPNAPIQSLELGAFGGIRMTYRARLPKGIPGLLFLLKEEEGGQYYADPPPPPAEDWQTITIPFSAFKFAPWTRDPNGKFDPDAVRAVSIGAHGTASGAGGDGLIEVRSLEAVPPTTPRTPRRR